MSELRTVVVIAFYFPPDGGAGTQRAAKFCKWLGDEEWIPVVVSRRVESSTQSLMPQDAEMLDDLRSGIDIIRMEAESPNVGSMLRDTFSLDSHAGWAACVANRIDRVIEQKRPACVLITMSPFSLSTIGRRIATMSDVPVVYDLRDPWTLDGWPTYRSRREWQAHRKVMLETLSSAAGVIANTPEAGRCFQECLTELDTSRLCVIPNGYDAEDFDAVNDETPDPHVFTLVHTGSLHSKTLYHARGPLGRLRELRQFRCEPIRPEGRTAMYLLRAIRKLRETGHPLADRLRVKLVGVSDDATDRCVAESGVGDQVEMVGYVSHRESVGWLLKADALFLPLHGLPAGMRSRIVPGKTYEYLASGKPILACLPAGDARDLVERSGVGFCAAPCDEHQITDRLADLLDRWARGALPSGPQEWVRDYDRRVLTGQLSVFLDTVCGVSDSSSQPAQHRLAGVEA